MMVSCHLCVCVLLHGLNICVFEACLSCSGERRSGLRAAASSRRCLSSPPDVDCFKVLTPRERRPNQIFSLAQKSDRACFDWLALWKRKTPRLEDPRSHAHKHAIVPQRRSRNSIDIPGNSLSSQCNFLFSLLFSFGLMNVDPCDLPVRGTCRGSTRRHRWPPSLHHLQTSLCIEAI